MGTDIPIRAVGLRQRNLLIGMYDRFEPLGAALVCRPSKPAHAVTGSGAHWTTRRIWLRSPRPER